MSGAGLRSLTGEAAEPRGGAQPARVEVSPAELLGPRGGISDQHSACMRSCHIASSLCRRVKRCQPRQIVVKASGSMGCAHPRRGSSAPVTQTATQAS